MPYSDSPALKIFLSHASEDQGIADVLARTLSAAFVDAIEITMMSEFPSGLNWRRLIYDSIERTDLLIAIATGRLKPSHSFTGLEVGSFSFSLRSKPKMAAFPLLDRRMIPFAVLAQIPDTTSEFEGIDIDPSTLRDVRFNAGNLATNMEELYRGGENAADAMVFKLLGDIEDIIGHAGSLRTRPREVATLQQRIEILRGHARSLCKALFEIMLNREKSVVIPKSKLIIRAGAPSVDGGSYEAIEGAEVRIDGPCYDAFGLSDGLQRSFSWGEFISKAQDEDIVFAWREALSSLVSSAQRSSFIDNNIILSFDRKKIFRIFVSRITVYYNNSTEFHVYVVEILRPKDYGDPATTLLLKTMQVSLGYRFMFLEEESEFAPGVIKATKLSDLKGRVLDLINGLNLLLQTSEEYNLNNARTILNILGRKVSDNLDDLYATWDRERDALYTAAKRVLKLTEVTNADKQDFTRILESFCDHTREMNRTYTNSVLSLLQKKVTAPAQSRKAVSSPSRQGRDRIARGPRASAAKRRIG